MNNPINYIGVLGESFANKFYSNNSDTNERKSVFDLVTSGEYKKQHSFTIMPGKTKYVNHEKSMSMYNNLFNQVASGKNEMIYGFDIETFGNILNPASSIENNTAMITEFTLSSIDVKHNKSNNLFETTPTKNIFNYTFGVNKEQASELKKIIDKVSLMQDTNTLENLTKTELVTFENLQKYGGENLSTKGANEFFTFDKKTGTYGIKKHAPIEKFNVQQAKQGLSNMLYIGENQFFGTPKGKLQVDNIIGTMNNIKTNKGNLVSYNGISFDQPFIEKIFNKYNIKDDLFNGLNHFDMYQVSKSSIGFNMLDKSLNIVKSNATQMPTEHINTLGSQSVIRGIEPKGQLHEAVTDVDIMLRTLFEGNFNMFNDFNEGFANSSAIDLNTFDKSKVLYSNKALPIGSYRSQFNSISTGVLDQYIYEGTPLHHYSYSTGVGQYYSIKDFGFIPKEKLHKDALELLPQDKDGLWYLNLNNMAKDTPAEAMIFRDNIDDINKILQTNFNMYHYFPEDKYRINDTDIVSQNEIDIRSDVYEIDKIRRDNDRIRNPKDYKNINRVRKDVAMYEAVSDNYIKELDNLDDIVNELDLPKKLESLNVTKGDVKSFIKRYGRIEDEYGFNKKVLSHIDANITSQTLKLGTDLGDRERRILSTIQTDAYNMIVDEMQDLYVDKNLGNIKSNIPENMKVEKLKNQFLGLNKRNYIEADLNRVDILRNTKENIIKSNENIRFGEITNNSKYTSVDASNIENFADKIKNISREVSKGYGKGSNEYIKAQKQYLNDLTFDLEKRGVLPKGYSKKVTTTNDISEITNSIANDVWNVLNVANEQLDKTQLLDISNIRSNKAIKSYENPIARQYAGLKRTTFNAIDINGRSLNNKSFSEGIFSFLQDQGIDVDEKIGNVVKNYSKNAPKSFPIKTKDDFISSDLVNWFKNLGYTDENIETLKSSLFKSSTKSTAIGDPKNNLAFHFYNKEINGVNVPFMAIANSDTNVLTPLMKGDKLEHASEIMLPYVINPNVNGTNNGFVDSDTRNRVVKIGDTQKSIAKKHSVYIDKRTNTPRLKEEDIIDEILGVTRLKRNEILDLMKSKEYSKLSNRINNYTKRLQLDEIGTSPKITSYDPSGNIGLKYVPRLSDLDLADKYISDDLLKYLPYLYEEADNKSANENIVKLIDNLKKDFSVNYEEDYLPKVMKTMKNKIEGNRNFKYSDVSPDIQEWVRRYAVKDNSYIKAIKEYTKITNDAHGAKIVDKLLNKGYHAFTKDSHGTRMFLDTGLGPMGATGSHLTGISRPLNAQVRGSIPFLYDELSYSNVQNKIASNLGITINPKVNNEKIRNEIVEKMQEFGVRYTPAIATDNIVEGIKEINRGGYNIVQGITGNLKQSNVQKFLTNFNNIRSNEAISLSNLNGFNKVLGGNYSLEDYYKVLDTLGTNYATYEQGGMLNPRFNYLFDKPQIFTQEVSEEFYNNMIKELEFTGGNDAIMKGHEALKLTKGQDLGFIGDNDKSKIFKDQPSRIISAEPLGNSVNKKYKLNYVHENENLESAVKLFAGYGEKGVFSIPKVEDRLNPLLYEVYDNLFGKDTFAVSSFEIFKHQNFGAIAFSDIATMYDAYSQHGDNYTNKFINRLNELLPQYNFQNILHPTTGTSMLQYNSSPKLVGEHTMFNALSTLRNELENSTDDIDKLVLNKIKTNEANGVIRTEFNVAPLEEGMGNNVKYDKRTARQLDFIYEKEFHDALGEKAEVASKELQKYYDSKVINSKSYENGKSMLQNIKSSINLLQGKDGGVVENITIGDVKLPKNMATWDEIAESMIFDFSSTNEKGAKINSFSIKIPNEMSIANPLNAEESITDIIIPLTRPYQDDTFMLSEMQKKISSVMIDLKDMEEAGIAFDTNKLINSQKSLEKNYSSLIASYYDEMVNKDGLFNKFIKSARFDEGSFSLATKVVEPLLDGEGKFMDRYANNFYDIVNGKVRYLDNVELSEGAFKNLGISFENIGKQIFDNTDEFKSFTMSEKGISELNNIKSNIGIIKELNQTLNDPKRMLSKKQASQLERNLNLANMMLEQSYEQIGKVYMMEEGIYSLGHRFPLIKKKSVVPVKIYLNEMLDGNKVVVSPFTAAKMKLDTDGDIFAQILTAMFDNKTGELNLYGENNYINKIFKTLHEHESRYNELLAEELNSDRLKQFVNNEVISGSDKPYYELFKEYIEKKGLGKSIIDFDNFYYDEHSIDQALSTTSSKTSIGYISNENFILRELSSYKYSANDDLEGNKLIREYTDIAEQKIFNKKHSTDSEYGLILAKPYKQAITDLSSADPEIHEKAIDDLINISKKSGIFDADEIIDSDKIINYTDVDKMNKSEKQIFALFNMMQDDDIKNIRKDPLFWKQSYSENKKIDAVMKIFNYEGGATYEGKLKQDWDVFEGLDDFKYLTINGEQVGRGTYIQNGEYSPYMVSNLIKTELGADILELQNMYGENYHLVGTSFESISEQLTKQGFNISNNPLLPDNELGMIDKMFASEDDFIREMTYNKTVSKLSSNKKINDSKKFNKNLKKVGIELGLNDETLNSIKNSLIEDGTKGFVKKYKTNYSEMFSQLEDVFDETYNIIRTLEETNAFTEHEIMQKAKSFFDESSNIVKNITDDMNDNIRRMALESQKQSFYRKNIPNHLYTSLKEYITKYENLAKINSPAFNNTISNKPLNHIDYFDVDAPNKYKVNSFEDLIKLGNIEVTIDNKTDVLNNFGIDEIVDFVTKENKSGENILEAQEKAKYYIVGKYELDRRFGDALERDGDKLKIIDSIAKDMNDAVVEGSEKLSKEVKEKVQGKLIKGVSDVIKKHKIVSSLFFAGAIGIASEVSNKSFKTPMEVSQKPNGGSPGHDGEYEQQPTKKQRVAPSSDNRVYLSQNRGRNYEISATNVGKSSIGDTISKLKRFSKTNSTINVNQRQDTSKVSDSWIEEKLNNMF